MVTFNRIELQILMGVELR